MRQSLENRHPEPLAGQAPEASTASGKHAPRTGQNNPGKEKQTGLFF